MAHRIYRIIFLLFVAAGAVRLSAQSLSSEVGVWIVDTKWTDTTLGNENINRSGQFDEKTGYGLSFNHFWTEHFSTELSAQRFSADAVLIFHTVEGEEVIDIGEVDATTLTAMAQWHFNRDGRFAPYVGAGVTRLSAEYEPDEQGPRAFILGGNLPSGPYDFETQIALSVAAGANVRITDRLYLAGELKYMPETDLDRTRMDPVFYSAGVKVRF
jgi:outer membrane protein W